MTKRLVIMLGIPVIAAAAIVGGGRMASAGSAQNATHVATAAPTAVAACSGTHIWAVVNSNGTLARHGGACGGTTATETTPGGYDVVFPKNIVNCAYIAVLGSSGRMGTVPPGYATVVGDISSSDGVFVETWSSSGVETAEGFHLVVDC